MTLCKLYAKQNTQSANVKKSTQKPVSYTHLDVYKRQDHGWIVRVLQKEKEKDVKKNQDEEINKEIVKSVISRGIPVENVSYTHLDVYKRQAK